MKTLKNIMLVKRLGFLASILVTLSLSTTITKGENEPVQGGVSLRVVGGTVADPSDYPWMVGLVSGDETNLSNAQFCGGTLIAPTWVLTAAHCVENEIPGNVDVVIGGGDLRDSSSFQRIRVARIITHSGYFNQGDGIDADIALLELSEAVEQLAPLPLIGDESLAAPNTMSRTVGWGLTSEGGNPSVELREVDIPIVSLDTANATGAYDAELTSDMLPAGFPGGGKDSCNGDSGGPLVVGNQAGDGYVLAGIVSFGSHLGCAAPNAYGIYTRVSYFVDWVQRGMAGDLEVTETGGEGNGGGNEQDGNGDFSDWGDDFDQWDDDFSDWGDDFDQWDDDFSDWGDDFDQWDDDFSDWGDDFDQWDDDFSDWNDDFDQWENDPEWEEIWNLITDDSELDRLDSTGGSWGR